MTTCTGPVTIASIGYWGPCDPDCLECQERRPMTPAEQDARLEALIDRMGK